jgi:hypothetical protein
MPTSPQRAAEYFTNHSQKPITPRELQDALHIKPSTLGFILTEFVKKDWISRVLPKAAAAAPNVSSARPVKGGQVMARSNSGLNTTEWEDLQRHSHQSTATLNSTGQTSTLTPAATPPLESAAAPSLFVADELAKLAKLKAAISRRL